MHFSICLIKLMDVLEELEIKDRRSRNKNQRVLNLTTSSITRSQVFSKTDMMYVKLSITFVTYYSNPVLTILTQITDLSNYLYNPIYNPSIYRSRYILICYPYVLFYHINWLIQIKREISFKILNFFVVT